jgi:hypothetical protein
MLGYLEKQLLHWVDTHGTFLLMTGTSKLHRAAMKRRHQNPIFAAEHNERCRTVLRKLNSDPEWHARQREARRERMRKLWADPVIQAKRRANSAKANRTEEKREKSRLGSLKRWHG